MSLFLSKSENLSKKSYTRVLGQARDFWFSSKIIILLQDPLCKCRNDLRKLNVSTPGSCRLQNILLIVNCLFTKHQRLQSTNYIYGKQNLFYDVSLGRRLNNTNTEDFYLFGTVDNKTSLKYFIVSFQQH